MGAVRRMQHQGMGLVVIRQPGVADRGHACADQLAGFGVPTTQSFLHLVGVGPTPLDFLGLRRPGRQMASPGLIENKPRVRIVLMNVATQPPTGIEERAPDWKICLCLRRYLALLL